MLKGFKLFIPFMLLLVSSVLQAQETVTVDFSVNNGLVTNRASGFLHGMNSTTPSAALVNPLKGKIFRGDSADNMMDPANYARVIGQNAVNMYVLGDAWIQNQFGFNPSNARTVTASTMSAWNSFVAQAVNTAKSNGQTFQWDIWNEPDLSQFWTGSEAEYQTMWQNAVNTIKGIDPAQAIVGPSCSCGWGSWTTDLMAFAKSNGVLPNVVDMHEASFTPAHVTSDLAAAKAYLAANDPSINQISISEYVDEGSDYLPGTNVQYIAAIERSQIYEAAHTCWFNDCFDNSLDGLIGSDGVTVHAIWYAYQAYANITGNIVGVTPSATVDGVAGQDSSLQQAYSVFGRAGGSGDVTVAFTNISSAGFLNNGGSVHVTAYSLTNDNGSGSSGPSQIISADYTVSSNSISVTIPGMGSNDVAIIQLTKGAAQAVNHPNPPTNMHAIAH